MAKTRAICPCCGYPTLDERAGDEICPLCCWQDDGQDDRERSPDSHSLPEEVAGGPNGDYSLSEARENFAQYTTMYRPGSRGFERKRALTEVRQRIAEAYDRVVSGEASFVQVDAKARTLLDKLRSV